MRTWILLLLTACSAPAAAPPTPRPTASAKQGEPCPDGVCESGTTCMAYYGIAGPNGPEFKTCEIPCAKHACPTGQLCVTIADGPGRVCRGE